MRQLGHLRAPSGRRRGAPGSSDDLRPGGAGTRDAIDAARGRRRHDFRTRPNRRRRPWHPDSKRWFDDVPRARSAPRLSSPTPASMSKARNAIRGQRAGRPYRRSAAGHRARDGDESFRARQAALFASMGIPEVWRCDGERVTILVLDQGRYDASPASRALPILTSDELTRFLVASRTMLSPEWSRAVRDWARDRVATSS